MDHEPATLLVSRIRNHAPLENDTRYRYHWLQISLEEPMDARYQIDNADEILSPGLVVFQELVEQNLREMIRIAGSAARLRPHCKTHKMRAVVEMQLQAGIVKHKCATFAEAEMLADAGVRDIVLAYNLVGPSITRAEKFLRKYPGIQFAVTGDHSGPLRQLSQTMTSAGLQIGVLLDIDSGQHRTGVPVGDSAAELYRLLSELPGIRPAGLHVYDGQNHQTPLDERTAAVDAIWDDVTKFRDQLVKEGLSVPSILAGGTGSFPIFAAKEDPALELSPGTVIFHDAGYAGIFPDLQFVPAALLLTRVISRPTPQRLTLDLGNKAVAADPPVGSRLLFPDLPDAREVLHNEEHLVLETDRAGEFQPGDAVLAIPRHVCPTSALHQSAWVVRDHRVTSKWDVTARNRQITI
jgi:D-threonine aldolase